MTAFGWLWLAGCHAPPEAPEGLDDSLSLLLRSFHADDDTLAAGLTGLVTWFDTEGEALLGGRADLDNVGAYGLRRLDRADTAQLPVEGDPDPAAAPGVVSVAEMGCALSDAEALVVRPDQHVVFDTTWNDYDRTYVTDRALFAAGEADPVRDPILDAGDPGDAAALTAHPDALMLTDNVATASQLGYTITLDLDLRFRHGSYDLDGEPTDAYLVLGFMPHAAFTRDDDGQNGIAQSYSLDVNIARGTTAQPRTLRVFAAWSELSSPLLAADSPLVLSQGVNTSQDAAERMNAICAGDVTLPPAP